jgi:hypothetical protein
MCNLHVRAVELCGSGSVLLKVVNGVLIINIFPAEGGGIVRPPPPPAPPPAPKPVTPPNYTEPLVILGPFGKDKDSGGDGFNTYDHWNFALGGGRRIRRIKVYVGSASSTAAEGIRLQVTYGDRVSFWPNLEVGGTERVLDLTDDEYISSVALQAGARVESIRFITNTGRSISAGEWDNGTLRVRSGKWLKERCPSIY